MTTLARPAHLARRFLAVAGEAGLAEAAIRAARHLGRRAGGELNRARPGADLPLGYPLGPAWQELARQGAFHAARRIPGAAPAIVAVAPASVPQSRRYRVEALADLWTGAEVRVFDPAEARAAAGALQDATHLVFARCARSEATAMLLYEARRLGLPVLYDLDDPLMSLPACAGYRALAALPPAERIGTLRAAPQVLELMSAADAVAVSTPALAAEAARFCPRPVWLRRNLLRPGDLALGARLAALPRAQGPVTFALPTGSRGRGPDLAPLLPALEAHLARAPGTRILVIGPLDLKALPRAVAAAAEVLPVLPYADYLAALARADAVLIPLADDPFNRCKSAARLLDAAAVARPVAASPVGEIGEVLRDGTTGLLAATTADWAEALATLSDPGRARAMGAANRAWAEAQRHPDAPGLAGPALLAWGRA
jgi:hypothetical protein